MTVGTITAGSRALTTSGSNPSASPGMPSGVGDGDKLVIADMIRANNNTVPNTPGTPSGWTAGNTFGATGVSRALRLSWFYRDWASGVSAPTITLTASSGTVHYALMMRVPGALLGGDPTEYLGANGTPATSATLVGPFGGGTTGQAGCGLIVAGCRENDVTNDSTITAPTHSGLSFTLLDSTGVLSTDDWAFAVAAALVPNPATVGNLSFGIEHDTNQQSLGQQWALAPAPDDTGQFFPFLGV